MGRNQRDEVSTTSFIISNETTDHTLNANANDDLATADVLATLLQDLAQLNIITAL